MVPDIQLKDFPNVSCKPATKDLDPSSRCYLITVSIAMTQYHIAVVVKSKQKVHWVLSQGVGNTLGSGVAKSRLEAGRCASRNLNNRLKKQLKELQEAKGEPK